MARFEWPLPSFQQLGDPAPLADRHYVIEHGRIVETVTMAELDAKMDALHILLGV